MKLEKVEKSWATCYYFYCSGCKSTHMFECRNDGKHPSWSFNGNMESPTFTPSLCYPDRRCHLTVTDGKIKYHDDCTHSLVGQTINLPELE